MNEPTNATEDHAARMPISGGAGVGGRSGRPTASPHATEFLLATTALVVLGVIALAIAVVTAHNASNDGPLQAWSSWSPQDPGTQGAREIADHLSPYYRINGTDQLDAVTVLDTADPSQTANVSGQTPTQQIQVAIKAEGASSNQSAVQLLGGKTIAFNLCGLGSSNCSIGQGTPSSGRLLLLRREALELALYTFRYLPGVENVVAVLPPAYTTQSATLSPTPPSSSTAAAPLDLAVLFDREELQPFTSDTSPLINTLTLKYPPTVSQLSLWHQTSDAAATQELTAHSLFTEQFVHAQDGSYLLELNPVPPQ